jgi:hypothetical protein
MKLLIKRPFPKLKSISNLNYNEKGPSKNGSNDIYIDCQPVDADGNLLIDKSNKDFYKKFNINNNSTTTSINSNIPIIIGSVFGALVLLIIVIAIFKNLSFIGLPSTNGINLFGLPGLSSSSTNSSRVHGSFGPDDTSRSSTSSSSGSSGNLGSLRNPTGLRFPSLSPNFFDTRSGKKSNSFGSLFFSRSPSKKNLPTSLTKPARQLVNVIDKIVNPLNPLNPLPTRQTSSPSEHDKHNL